MNFKGIIWKYINILLKSRLCYHYFYQNINIDYTKKTQKRVLISYITTGFSPQNKITHTNVKESMQIVHYFVERGFIVDIINCNSLSYLKEIKNIHYDVVFGFGELFYQACAYNLDAIKIIYLTELYPEYSRQQEKIRQDYYYQRHKKSFEYERTALYYQEHHFTYVDYGILLGNDFTKRTFSTKINSLFLIKPTGQINVDYTFISRDIQKTKKNFMWFGSYGAIHKGLDLLVDAFSLCPDSHLYICGLNKKDQKKVSYMKNYSNIVDIGFVDVQSDEFIQLVNSCSYVILPSCSEGMSTSVLTCMNHSLIPVVSENCGIDVFNFGILMKDYHVNYIVDIIRGLSQKENSEVEKMHKLVYDYSLKNFTLDKFSFRFKQILDGILQGEKN